MSATVDSARGRGAVLVSPLGAEVQSTPNSSARVQANWSVEVKNRIRMQERPRKHWYGWFVGCEMCVTPLPQANME